MSRKTPNPPPPPIELRPDPPCSPPPLTGSEFHLFLDEMERALVLSLRVGREALEPEQNDPDDSRLWGESYPPPGMEEG